MARITQETPDLAVIRFEHAESEWFAMARKIREEVFISEQQVDEALEYDHEEESEHYILTDHGEPKATARWRETPNGIKLERFAVPMEFRSKGLGSILLHRVLGDVLPLAKPIYLHAQITAVNYYTKAGFVCEGELFYEAGIAHYRMVHKG
jgi:predicted GNAT family N-acyltransferase